MLRLRPLRLTDQAEVMRAQEELATDDFTFIFDWEHGEVWSHYIAEVAARRRGVDLPAGRVPATFLVAEVDGMLVGRVSIRHALNPALLREGGHIGYGVRPAHRRRGYATEILRQALIIARAEGVDRVLVTCDDGNVASATVIERAGGVLEDIGPDDGGVGKRRYWID